MMCEMLTKVCLIEKDIQIICCVACMVNGEWLEKQKQTKNVRKIERDDVVINKKKTIL